jgi:hypothetical protein
MNKTKNVENTSRNTLTPKLMCLCCGGKICLMNTCFGLTLATSSIRGGFNNYKLHIAKPNMK